MEAHDSPVNVVLEGRAAAVAVVLEGRAAAVAGAARLPAAAERPPPSTQRSRRDMRKISDSRDRMLG